MFSRVRRNLSYANVMSSIAVFLAVATGGAYAANSVFSGDIVNGEVKTADIALNAITSGRVLDSSLSPFDIQPESLSSGRVTGLDGGDIDNDGITGADVDESSLARVPDAGKLGGIDPSGYVQGRGESVANRDVIAANNEPRGFLAIPGLGEIIVTCGVDGFKFASMKFQNNSGGAVDLWFTHESSDRNAGTLTLSSGQQVQIAAHAHVDGPSSQDPLRVIKVGAGGLGTARRMATLVVATKYADSTSGRCGFEAQGTVWSSP